MLSRKPKTVQFVAMPGSGRDDRLPSFFARACEPEHDNCLLLKKLLVLRDLVSATIIGTYGR